MASRLLTGDWFIESNTTKFSHDVQPIHRKTIFGVDTHNAIVYTNSYDEIREKVVTSADSSNIDWDSINSWFPDLDDELKVVKNFSINYAKHQTGVAEGIRTYKSLATTPKKKRTVDK